MSDIGTFIDFPRSLITTASNESLGIEAGGQSTLMNGTTSAWPSSNLALYVPMKLGYFFTVNNVFWINGATVGTNTVQVGVYDSQGNRLVAATATTTSGASSFQSVSTTSTILQPGLYYIAMVMNGTTDTILVANSSVAFFGGCGVLQQASAAPLPSSATYVTSIQTILPLIGVTTNSTI